MKILAFSTILLAAGFFLFSCKHTRYTPVDLPAKQLQWGAGGGFTGKETTYLLLENGQIFKRDGVGALLQELEGTKKKTAQSLFKTADTLDIIKMDFMHPGNTYSFLEMRTAENAKRIAWGDTKFPVTEQMQNLYKQLMQLVAPKK